MTSAVFAGYPVRYGGGIRRSVAFSAYFIAMSVAIAACSTDSPAPSAPEGPYAEMFAQALDETRSDYSREVLSDYAITRAEYDESQRLYADCVNEGLAPYGSNLFRLLPGDDGQYSYALDASEDVVDIAEVQVMPQCEEEFLGGGSIASIFNSQLTNPSNLSIDTLIAGCLRDAGLVGADYSPENAQADRMVDVFGVTDSAQVDLSLTTELDLSQEPALECVTRY
jgi:hypothetical protein